MPNPLPFLFWCWCVLAAARAQSGTVLAVRGLPPDAPLRVTASHDGTRLSIVAAIDAGWHLYGRDVGGGQPVAVRVDRGSFVAAGDLATPMDGKGLITGKAELTLPLRRTAPGDALVATMQFMVCDALQCLPPIELELAVPAPQDPGAPIRVLLVAVDDTARTQRIAAFLRARGCTPTVATYADVTAAQCDAHDVVVADSPTFQQLRGKKVPVERFPETGTPVVAVGLLGTRLLEANKVAMASGYI